MQSLNAIFRQSFPFAKDSAAAKVAPMLLLGFSAGLPLLLIFSTLSLWLREAGLARSLVTMFSWAALGYSFKFVWAPLVDQLALPWLTDKLGRRRAWLLLSQICIIGAILLMAAQDPALGAAQVRALAIASVLLGFSSATQDIVIDAYRIESAPPKLQAMMSAAYIAGYRIGMLVAGAGGLYLAAGFGASEDHYMFAAWQKTYVVMAAVMLIGVLTTLMVREPEAAPRDLDMQSPRRHAELLALFVLCAAVFVGVYAASSGVAARAVAALGEVLHAGAAAAFLVACLRLTAALSAAVGAALLLVRMRLVQREVAVQSYVAPLQDFFARYGVAAAAIILPLVGLYRISDIVLGVISNVFYQDLGFSKVQIANAVKTFGLGMTILGGFVGGGLSMKFGVMRILFLGALLSALTNVLFYFLAKGAPDLTALYLVVGADNLSAGLASAAFVAFLSALTHIRFTAVQFALFTSLMTLLPKVLGGYSGAIVDRMGYEWFFIFTAVIGVPVLVLVYFAARYVRRDS